MGFDLFVWPIDAPVTYKHASKVLVGGMLA